jgi:hypothetical protein
VTQKKNRCEVLQRYVFNVNTTFDLLDLLLEEVFIHQKVVTGEYYVVDRYHFKYFWELKPKIVINDRT